MINIKVIVLLVVLAVAGVSLAEDNDSRMLTLKEFAADLEQLKLQRFKQELSTNEIAALKQKAANYSLPADSWSAILQLWLAGEFDFIHLLWWQKDDSETRTLIVSIEWCMFELPAKSSKNWPASVYDYERQAKRFNEVEREMRIRETDFVRQNHSVLSKAISSILSASNSKMAKRYQAIVDSESRAK